MNVNGRIYDEDYISNFISVMLNAEGKPENEQTISETKKWLLTSSYLLKNQNKSKPLRKTYSF